IMNFIIMEKIGNAVYWTHTHKGKEKEKGLAEQSLLDVPCIPKKDPNNDFKSKGKGDEP
ncbi:hypothetical protein ACJX0J_012250, partial [Zea mays]